MSGSDKNVERYNKYMSGNRIIDWVNYLYFIAVLGVYPWILNDAYFDITITKYKFITTATFAYIILFIIAYVTELMVSFAILDKLEIKTSVSFYKKEFWKRPGFWSVAFLLANIFAYIVSIDQKNSMMGANGRYMGCLIYVMLCIMFLILSNRARISEIIIYVFAAATFFSYIVAILQHAGNDFMGYKDKISRKSYYIFTSTFGNINMFASFICISLPVFLGIYIFSKKLLPKIVSAVLVIMGGMCLIISNSDSVYLGVGITFLMLFFIAFYNDRMRAYIESVFWMLLGNLFVVIMRNVIECEYDKNRGGVADIIDKPFVAVALVLFVALVYMVAILLDKKAGEKLRSINKKKFILCAVGFIVIVGILCIFVGNAKGISLFVFNYEWGTYRGYIWTKCVELFEDAPVTHKVFGYGNETLKMLTVANFNEEMIDVTGKTYDNAHNELLQYLVTTGIVGLISYIGLFLSSLIYIIKNSKKNPIAIACAVSVCSYFVQGIINLNQPITTPYFFVIMAMGVGYVNYLKKCEPDS